MYHTIFLCLSTDNDILQFKRQIYYLYKDKYCVWYHWSIRKTLTLLPWVRIVNVKVSNHHHFLKICSVNAIWKPHHFTQSCSGSNGELKVAPHTFLFDMFNMDTAWANCCFNMDTTWEKCCFNMDTTWEKCCFNMATTWENCCLQLLIFSRAVFSHGCVVFVYLWHVL